MPTGVGVQDAWIGLGEESVYGTSVARTRWLFHNTESIRAIENKNFAGALHKVGRNAARQVQGLVGVSGDFSFNPGLSYHAYTMLLKHLMGTVSSSQPDTTAAPTVYRHSFTPADALPTGLSLEVGKDVLSHLFDGCKVTGMRFAGSAGALLDCSVSIIGRQSSSISDSGESLTEGNIPPLTDTTATFGGTTLNVIDFSISVENALTVRNFVNSRFTSEPLRNGKRRVSGSFRVELEDASLWSDWRNATRRALTITVNGLTITGSYKYYTKFTMPVVELVEAQAQADTEGPLVIPVSFEAFYDTTNENELTIEVQNENSAAV
jgi:hypothetical protein